MASPQRQRLSDFMKGQIIALHNNGLKPSVIHHQLQIPTTTICSFLQRFKNRNSIDDLPRVGRPRKSSESDDRHVLRLAHIHTRVPMHQLRVESGSNLSVASIRRRLREEGIRKWRAVKRPRLTPAHVKKRKQWAKEHLNWKIIDFEKVDWSDECSIEKGADPRGVWVFRTSSKAEKFLPKNVATKNKSGCVSLMVWGCFTGTHLGPLVSFRGKNTADTYVNTLRNHLLPFIQSLPSDVANEFIFQQDNATIHTAKKTRQWFEENGIQVMEWPPNSPDMNPIEHLWRALKAALHQRFPDTRILPGGPEKVQEILYERLQVVWQEIGEKTLRDLVDSMPRRAAALWQAKGWHTHY